MPNFDPRTLNREAFQALQALHSRGGDDLQEQRNYARELYTYLSTWGLMRLKAEETALTQDGKKKVVKAFFQRLQSLSGVQNLAGDRGLEILLTLSANEYLGLTGLAIELANEFGFWANAVYEN